MSDHFAKLLQHVVSGKGENQPITIPPQQRIWVLGDVIAGKASTDSSFVLEPPDLSPLPGELILQCTLLNISRSAAKKIPIFIQNATDQSVILQPRKIIDGVAAAACVTPLASEQSSSLWSDCLNGSHADDLTFDNPLPCTESKARIPTKLNSIRDIFALNETSN